MNCPEMIIFDNGHTLLYEPDWNSERGNRALFAHVIKNPKGVSVEEYTKMCTEIFGKMEDIRKSHNCDISARAGNRVVAELLGIEFSLTPLERESVFWTAASNGAVMPYAEEMLDYLNENGIRTAVISNLVWSGEALTERFERLLPNNKFEFVITSSDYMYRKPSRLLFDIALNKAGLTSDKVWYCGNSVANDIEGAHGAGIFPVLYDGDLKSYSEQNDGLDTDFDFLRIHDWRELIAVLKKIVR
ncbi:MAG: HAD hydrolase-like protein [Ruminococcaceae bacterium]|nr:HAD hydrolase-like protein [Oscillospiraceae bacterium]